jgi:hypothetical protein
VFDGAICLSTYQTMAAQVSLSSLADLSSDEFTEVNKKTAIIEVVNDDEK